MSGPAQVDDARVEVRRGFDFPWAKVPEVLLDAELSGVSDRGARLWALLERYAGLDGQAFPGRRTLARRLRCSLDTLDRTIAHLEQTGWLEVERRKGQPGEPNRTSIYTLLVPIDPALASGPEDGGTPSRTHAATPSRTHAATLAAPVRPKREPLNERVYPHGPAAGATAPAGDPAPPAAQGQLLALDQAQPADGQRNPQGNPPSSGASPDQVRQVFDAWEQTKAEVYGARYRPSALTPERRDLIRKRLASYPLDTLLAAARGWRHFPHNTGADGGARWDSLELVLRVNRDVDNVERFATAELDETARPRSGGLARLEGGRRHPREERMADLGARFQAGADTVGEW